MIASKVHVDTIPDHRRHNVSTARSPFPAPPTVHVRPLPTSSTTTPFILRKYNGPAVPHSNSDKNLDTATTNSGLVDIAASNYSKSLAAGLDENDAAAQQLGAAKASDLTDIQEKYKDKVKAKLGERAEQLKKEKEELNLKFKQGKLAYARGQYPASVVLLEIALDEEGPFSQLGGEVQLWLALAYQACGREEDCIQLYKTVETTHPSGKIKKQAMELRYIMEAPKLELSPDEKVQIPVLTNLDPNRGGKQASRPRPPPQSKRKTPKNWDEEWLENYKPPLYFENRYVWAGAAATAALLAWASVYWKY